MNQQTYDKLTTLGFTGKQDNHPQEVINWLNSNNILRIEPYWRFLGSNPGFSWTKSWEEYSDRVEVNCDVWEELLMIALEQSVKEAL